MKLHLTTDNFYEGDVIVTEQDLDVEEPEVGDDLEDWALDVLFPFSGTGRTEGESCYFAKITACEARPDLVGHEFEWGS